MQEPKRSKKYLATAVPRRLSFHGQFAIPGHTPDYVRVNGEIQGFTHSLDAELAAARAALKMANDRLLTPAKFRPAAAMTANELSDLLIEISVTPTEAGHLLQTEFVMAWLNGERRVPHMARVILELMRDRKTNDQIRAITASAIIEGQQQ